MIPGMWSLPFAIIFAIFFPPHLGANTVLTKDSTLTQIPEENKELRAWRGFGVCDFRDNSNR